jgi:hypothetical protein
VAHEALRVEWQLGPHKSEAQEALTKDGLSLEQERSRGRTMTKARELLLHLVECISPKISIELMLVSEW